MINVIVFVKFKIDFSGGKRCDLQNVEFYNSFIKNSLF